MTDWFTTAIIGPGRLPLFFMMLAFATAFAFIRISTRMIRADVSWWPGNVTPGGLHIHHVVFGLVMMLVSGFGYVALRRPALPFLRRSIRTRNRHRIRAKSRTDPHDRRRRRSASAIFTVVACSGGRSPSTRKALYGPLCGKRRRVVTLFEPFFAHTVY
jgi:hypothetical protein